MNTHKEPTPTAGPTAQRHPDSKNTRVLFTALACAVSSAISLLVMMVGANPTANADAYFDVCPSRHEGVIGGHTTCRFAYNVGRAFDACGGCSNFVAYSPVTDERYDIVCEGLYPAHFTNGQVLTSTLCYTTSSNAQVVLW